MRAEERRSGIVRTPKLLWDILVRGRYRFVYDQMPILVDKMSWRKRINLLFSGGNLLYRRSSAWSMPLHMQFEFANFCNLHCPVCPTGLKAIQRKAQAMSPELFEGILNQAGPYLLTASLWAWGEPNLHPGLGEMLGIARRHRFITFLSTNGQNLNDERVIEALIDEPPTYLIVAIDGLTEATNAEFRVGAKLHTALEGVRRLAELKKQRGATLPVLHMRFIIMKHNEHEVGELQKFAHEHHFDYLSVRTLSVIDIDSPDKTHAPFVPEQGAFRAYHYDSGRRIEKTDYYCLQPFWFPTVFADGTVVSCEQDYNAQLPMGVVTDKNDFRSIWFGRQARAVRRRVRKENRYLSFCRNCPYRDRDITHCCIEGYRINENISLEGLV